MRARRQTAAVRRARAGMSAAKGTNLYSLLCIGFSPRQEHIDDFFLFVRPAKAGIFTILDFTDQPVLSLRLCIHADAVRTLGKLDTVQVSINQIDGQTPSRIIERANRDSIGMLPIFIVNRGQTTIRSLSAL